MSCVFCRFIAGEESEWNRRADVVLRAARVTAFISPRWWPGVEGNAIVISNEHVRGLSDVDDLLLADLYATAKRVAAAMRFAYDCEGISLRQHDGAAAGQEVDHIHVHVFPRHSGDRLYERNGEYRFAAPEERAVYALRLRAALETRKPGS